MQRYASQIDQFVSYSVQVCTFISAKLQVTLWKLFVYVIFQLV